MYIKIYAGLGNQIFQYCYGLLLQKQGHNVKYILSKTYDKDGRCFDLPEVFDLYNLKGTIAKNIFAPEGAFKNLRLTAKKIWAKYILHSYQTGFYQKAEYIESLVKDTNIYSFIKFKNAQTYMQSQNYKQIKACKNSVSLHIRGGDYLAKDSPFTGICTPEYYTNAINYIRKNTKTHHFFIFTNDEQYCSSILEPLRLKQNSYTIVQDEPELKDDPAYDLFLMSNCTNNIIANSTYSWWGAYFNQNNSKIVITPSDWIKNGEPTLEQIKCKEWINL
ncbi:alpha-1,2-fucosyltransferase [Treponema sp.]|uniref:alpha-1,2-fucosyltransferase n=1 Tax=Treponema sp. TaxID=166 RepID=UPI00298E6024|nr:alpha-1,2-fucosyltransferase [Treponema sp.]MCR5614449.1 alpha-1,2-fucosyltransferase [Treponema sp.]